MTGNLKEYYESRGIDYKSTYHKYYRIITQHLPPPPARILDLGCSDGELLLKLKRAGYDSVGVDIAESVVSRAREHSGCPVHQAAAEDLHVLSESTFDCVVCMEVMEHVTSPYDAMKELARVLKPGGRLILSTPNVHSMMRILYPLTRVDAESKNRHINCFDLAQWLVLFRVTGFMYRTLHGWGDPIFPRWKGIGRLLDRVFRRDRFRPYILLVAEQSI